MPASGRILLLMALATALLLVTPVNTAEPVAPAQVAPPVTDANWISMGAVPGVDGYVNAIAVDCANVYVGGEFSVVGDTAANNIAKWDGTSWSPLGEGLNRESIGGQVVNALAVLGSDLYAGGEFTMAGGSPANGIAKWNGSSWSALGSGIGRVDGFTPVVHALAVSGGDLYVGGYFYRAGGVAASHIAKWNGSS